MGRLVNLQIETVWEKNIQKLQGEWFNIDANPIPWKKTNPDSQTLQPNHAVDKLTMVLLVTLGPTISAVFQ